MAEPITGTIAAVASYVSSAFAASAVGTATLAQAATVFAVNAAATVAVNVAATALLQPKVGSSGPTMDFKSDTTAPIRGVMGRMAIGGNRIFKRTWGRTNVYLTSVALLSLGRAKRSNSSRPASSSSASVKARAGPLANTPATCG